MRESEIRPGSRLFWDRLRSRRELSLRIVQKADFELGKTLEEFPREPLVCFGAWRRQGVQPSDQEHTGHNDGDPGDCDQSQPKNAPASAPGAPPPAAGSGRRWFSRVRR